jgi:hypothetical protein
MFKPLTLTAAAIALATSGAAFAQKPMTDAQMDNVTAGALVNAVLVDVVDVRNNEIVKNVQVAIPVNAAVGIVALGGNLANAAVQQPGRQRQ